MEITISECPKEHVHLRIEGTEIIFLTKNDFKTFLRICQDFVDGTSGIPDVFLRAWEEESK